MTNLIAFALALLVVVLLVLDQVLWQGQGTIAMGRRIAALVNWVEFWR